jgi:predicted TIM-barrel fold metal-dependent hydrolase
MTNKTPHFDAHCHVFNLKYLFYELGEIVKDYLQGQYPNSLPEQSKDYPHSHPDSIRDLQTWLSQFAKASVRSEMENFCQIEKWSTDFWKDGRSFAAIPLMMDIYYLLAQPVGANQVAITSKDRNKIVSKLLKLIGWNEPYFDTPGFRHHRKELIALSQKKRGQVFPFFAVDPRRTAVIQTILKGKLVGKSGPFYGIKLYPRLGVHPQCKDFWPLYAWCESNQIPITTHCDIVGFPPPFFETKLKVNYGHWGEPSNFEPILKKHPKLILNFAHFGMSNESWPDQIAELMTRHPNVYSDLSCYTDIKKLRAFHSNHWLKPKVADKTMFGSDFDVFFAVSAGTSMQEYYESFKTVFSASDLERMSSETPKRFLGR